MTPQPPPILCPLPRRSITHPHASYRPRRTPSMTGRPPSAVFDPQHQRRRSSVSSRSSVGAALGIVAKGEEGLEYKEDASPASGKTEDDVLSEFLSLFSPAHIANASPPASATVTLSPSLIARNFSASPRQQRRFAPARPKSRLGEEVGACGGPGPIIPVAGGGYLEEAGYTWILGSPISRCRAPAPIELAPADPHPPWTPARPPSSALGEILRNKSPVPALPKLNGGAGAGIGCVNLGDEVGMPGIEDVRLGSPAP